jgi:iron(III) transport system substrate-binding protein
VEPPIVAYISLDEPYARPVLQAFERESRLRVQPLFDTEANKSRGLAQRILSEQSRPRADVFWSSEVLQMVRLREAGALTPYRSPSAAGIPERYCDAVGYWTGFAARFRVLVYHRRRLAELGRKPPVSLLDLADPAWAGEVAMANPLFGSTATEAAALFQSLGPERARTYYQARARNRTRTVDGNSAAADAVARGDALVGQTDIDDAMIRIDRGTEVGMVIPDAGGMGAVLIPNTVGLIRGGPNPAGAQRLIDFLLSPGTERMMAGLPSRQLPLHDGLAASLPEEMRKFSAAKSMDIAYSRLSGDYIAIEPLLRELFLR